MINHENKAIAERVLDSKTFYRSNIYHKLLNYLIEKNLQSEAPKEISIAIEVFEKGNDFNPSEDTSVRVHVHNLRKKLNDYYYEEGKDDPIRLTIPKGHYELFFEEAPKLQSSRRTTINYTPNKILLLLLIILISALLIMVYKSSSIPSNFIRIDSDNPIWAHYFKNELSTSIVIGDFLEFHEYDQTLERARRIQDYQINEIDSLNVYLKKYPERETEKWIIGELPHNSIFNIIDIFPVFLAYNKPFDIAFTSEMDIDYIKNRNIIYIGEFKNLRILNNLISALPVNIKTLPWWDGQITIEGDSSFTLETYHRWEKSRYIVDLGMIAKLPGQNGENYIICAGFGYNSQIKLFKLLGSMEGLTLLTNERVLKDEKMPDYFVSILEISGFDRASTRAEIRYFNEIADDYFNRTISKN